MTCENAACGIELNVAVYKGGMRLCRDCAGPVISASALANDVAISKRKYGISMTTAEVRRIRSNSLRPDGRYLPDPRYRDSGEDK